MTDIIAGPDNAWALPKLDNHHNHHNHRSIMKSRSPTTPGTAATTTTTTTGYNTLPPAGSRQGNGAAAGGGDGGGGHGRDGNGRCRRKKRVKKREYKSASVLTVSGTSGRSTTDRSINSASSVFPTSTPINTPPSSKPSTRSNSLATTGSKFLKGDRAGDLHNNNNNDDDALLDSDDESLGFDPVYSHDYDLKKQRALKGQFKDVLHSYFPDLIKSSKMAIPDKTPVDDDDYDTDLDQDLGLELLADERAKRCKEDGMCAEYKQRCRKYKVVPSSFFLRHITDEEMRLRYRYLGFGDSATMSHEIQNQPSVTKLDLQDNAMGPSGMLCFAEMLKSNAYITEANFSYNDVGVFGARLMKFILLKNVRLVKLSMAGNKFGERGAKYCAIAINMNSTLKEFDISHNGINDEGATLIGKALANNTGLEVLNLSWNNFGRKGAVNLAKGIKMNSKLRVLNLSMNGCHEEGSKALFSALKYNSALEELDLSTNRVGEESAKVLAKSLPYLRLQAIHLAFNPLSAEWTEKILRAMLTLEDGPLKLLNMEGVVVEDDFQLLAEALQQKDINVIYKIPPSSRERSRDIPLETLNHVVNFLDDVEMELSALVPQPSDGDVIMTVEDLFKQLEASGMFKESSRLMKLKQDSQRDFRRRFLVKELYLVMTRRRQSLNEVMFTAQAVNELDLTDSVEPLTTERSSFSDQTSSV